MITKEIISKIKITFQVTKACVLPVTLIVMSAFPTLIHEACQVFGVSYYIQNGGDDGTSSMLRSPVQGYSAGNGDT